MNTPTTKDFCNVNSKFKLQRSMLTKDNKLIFETNTGFDQALSDGFFLIKIPDKIDLNPGDIFAENFYKPIIDQNHDLNIYRGFNSYTPEKFNFPHEGYYVREADQAEQFFLEKRFWSSIYPDELTELAQKLNELAIIILENVLEHVGIPDKYWNEATGQCTANNGTHHLTFNHFRPEKNARGLNIHKDSGWVTVLRSQEPGLEAYINRKWEKINPVKGYFIINFGCAMEILTSKLQKPVAAIVHRVSQQSRNHNKKEKDRFSYALFTDNSLDEKICKGLYEYKDNKMLLKMNFGKFLKDILNATYNEDTVGLY